MENDAWEIWGDAHTLWVRATESRAASTSWARACHVSPREVR